MSRSKFEPVSSVVRRDCSAKFKPQRTLIFMNYFLSIELYKTL